MKLAPVFAAALLLVPLAACSYHLDDDDSTPGIAGSGSGTTRSFAVAGFSQVALRGSDDVDVRVGPAFSVRAEGPSDQLDKLKIVKDGDTLRIGRVHGARFHWGGHHEGVKIFVTMPRIAEANIAGSGDMTIDKAEGSKFVGSTAGSGGLSVGAISVDTADLSIAGSGDMALTGSAKQLTVNIAGSGNVDAGGLKAQGAKVSIAGSGGVKADVTGPAEVSVMGSGDVDLGAGAKCATSKMGSGSVRCGS
jgi:hypothetical protein